MFFDYKMKKILSKIYKSDNKQASQDIYNLYKSKWQVLVNYIYWANIIKNDLFQKETNKPLKQILLNWDFLLPDGAALRTFWKIWYKLWWLERVSISWPNSLSNINGTDFLPYIINDYISKVGKDKIKLVIYGSRAEFQDNIHDFITKNFDVELLYIQDGYTDFDHNKLQKIISDKWWFLSDNIYIFIVAMWTPKQEIRSYNSLDKLWWFIVMNQGGTMDFWAWFETRAPWRIRTLWLESIYRLATKPKKNFTKFMVSFAMIWEIVKRWILRK